MTSSASEETRTLPGLTGLWDGNLTGFSIERLTTETDVVFLALPDAASAPLAGNLLSNGLRVFDLSGAFRLRDSDMRQRWYPETPELEQVAVYGLTERRRELLRGASFVSCPGCYPTAALLALEPLVQAGLLSEGVIIDAKSGISGAGRKPNIRTHFSECHGNAAAYGVFAHRHGEEIQQELGRQITFVPHLIPLDRGILETIYAHVEPSTSKAVVADVFEQAYQNERFIRLRGADFPEIKHVVQTNYCDLGWTLDEATGRLVIVACLDNLIKGAAGQAVQNLNVALGFDEGDGLT
jgi:N-acetyl-gamma-glutamyl-phosphate reductase